MVYERRIARITGSMKSLHKTQIRVIINISEVAIISSLMENQPKTPNFIWDARMLSFNSLWKPSMNSCSLPYALMVLVPWIVSPR
jgi:hypothetical protein